MAIYNMEFNIDLNDFLNVQTSVSNGDKTFFIKTVEPKIDIGENDASQLIDTNKVDSYDTNIEVNVNANITEGEN